MDPFDALDAMVSAECDRAFGRPAKVIPWLGGAAEQYGASAADPARPAKDVRVIFSSGPSVERVGRRGEGNLRAEQAAEVAIAWVPATDFALLGYALRQFDRLEITGLGAFIISSIGPTNMGDVELRLTEVK